MNSAANGLRFGVAFALGLLAAGPAMASNTDSAPSPQQAPDLQGKVLALEAQIEEMRQRMPAAQAEAGDNTQMPRTTYHLAGYGFVDFVAPESGDSAFTQASFNPIFHALYDDRILFEGELEVTLGEGGDTEVGLEYATIGWLFSENAALIAGRFLSPLGNFRQNLHPAWINRLASEPAGFGHDGAAPNGELGLQLRGGWSSTPLGRLNYAVYVGNGPELEAGEDGLMAVMTEGVTRDIDGRKVVGGRIGWIPHPSVEVGVSIADGRAAVATLDGLEVSDDPVRSYRFDGADFAWRPLPGLDIRAEYLQQKAGAASGSIAPEAAEWRAWYAQAAHRFGGQPWEIVARYGEFRGPELVESLDQTAVGANFWLGSSTVVRATYEFNSPIVAQSEISNRLLLQMAHGF